MLKSLSNLLKCTSRAYTYARIGKTKWCHYVCTCRRFCKHRPIVYNHIAMCVYIIYIYVRNKYNKRVTTTVPTLMKIDGSVYTLNTFQNVTVNLSEARLCACVRKWIMIRQSGFQKNNNYKDASPIVERRLREGPLHPGQCSNGRPSVSMLGQFRLLSSFSYVSSLHHGY